MKTIATLIFVLFLGMAAQAQNASQEVKVVTTEMSNVAEVTVAKKVTLEKTTEVARLYKRKNSLVKKELSFTTKRNNAKMT